MAQTASARRVYIRHAQSYFEREKARALKFSFARTRSRRKLAGSTPTFIGQSWNISIEFVHISSFRESRGSITRRSKPCSIRFELGGKNSRRGVLSEQLEIEHPPPTSRHRYGTLQKVAGLIICTKRP